MEDSFWVKFRNEIYEHPLGVTITLCLIVIMSSCTARRVYCEWFNCKVEPVIEMKINGD